MLKDELVEKTSTSAQRASSGTQGKKQTKKNQHNKQTTKNNRERQTTQKDYKDVVRSCREEFRRAEAQIELNLATIVKDDNIHNIF